MNNLNLMDYPGDTPPFQPGDIVECIENRKPEFYSGDWTKLDGIKKGDCRVVLEIRNPSSEEWQWTILFTEGYGYNHSARLFRKVEGALPSRKCPDCYTEYNSHGRCPECNPMG